jgi:hypothetical protein
MNGELLTEAKYPCAVLYFESRFPVVQASGSYPPLMQGDAGNDLVWIDGRRAAARRSA